VSILKNSQNKRDKKRLLEKYDSVSRFQIEDKDGSYYPKEIKVPDIDYIPPAEPHILITDWYENPEIWYYMIELIPKLAEQAFCCYSRGLYLASFLCSLNCIELTLKYEYVRKLKTPKILEEQHFTLGTIIKKEELKKIRLAKYSKSLEILNSGRIGLLHFNPGRLISITSELGIDEIPTDNLFVWSKFAYFAYNLMYEITSKLYGKKRRSYHIKRGLEDYHRLEKARRQKKVD
jgi:hypothetical protein